MSGTLFRRCGCRTADGRQYPALVERPTEAQRAAACPVMLADAKHGRWSFRLGAGVDPVTKKRRQVNGGTYATRREASEARNAAAVRVNRGAVVAPSREVLADYLPVWLSRHTVKGRSLRPATRENYARYIAQDIAPSTLGGMRLGDIRRHHINAFLEQLSDAGRGAVTVRRIAAVVQGAMRAAQAEEQIEDNPATRLRLPAVDVEPFAPWEPAQVGHFLDVASTHRLGAFFELAVFTGLRRSELVGLRWSDIDTERGVLTVRTSKTDAGRRVVDLDDRSTGALMAWRLAQEAERAAWGPAWVETGHVFTYENGEPLKLQYATRLFDKLRVAAGLPLMTLHGLRHMSASLMIASGANLAVVSKRLGHSSVQVTGDIYAHLIGSASRDAANAAASLVPSARTVHAHRSQTAVEAASS
ncbi:tyrosine-type recombinase/integrase [Phycicoccus duodecadis]|uniref:Integrase n=1 Tax=Phycicoccus duodecadis TaxID=173053 RepID=A0A2N3YEX5_9MICO|nr:tyrosine-type recombinase/integrase [Phycicoccus duodecadis]PKW25414.1 integrase [Phycicoccus duodecadis]